MDCPIESLRAARFRCLWKNGTLPLFHVIGVSLLDATTGWQPVLRFAPAADDSARRDSIQPDFGGKTGFFPSFFPPIR